MKVSLNIFILFLIFCTFSISAKEIYIVVNVSNPISKMTASDCRKIFLRTIENWESGAKILPFLVSEDKSTFNYFLKNIIRKTPEQWDRYWEKMKNEKKIAPPRSFRDVKSAIRAVSIFKGSILILDKKSVSKKTKNILIKLD